MGSKAIEIAFGTSQTDITEPDTEIIEPVPYGPVQSAPTPNIEEKYREELIAILIDEDPTLRNKKKKKKKTR